MAGIRDPNEGSWREAQGRLGLVGEPTVRATAFYRMVIGACRALATLLRIRIVVVGVEHLPLAANGLPPGGWIAAGLPHRSWIDPFVVTLGLPVEPRISWFGDGRAINRSALRRWIFARIGGVVPIWPDGRRQAVDAHFEAAGRVLDAGGVFGLFPESGPAVPVGRARPFGGGIGYIAIRTGAPIVPLILGGTDLVYLGQRIILQVLPSTDWRTLADAPPSMPAPAPGSREERDLARRVTDALHASTAKAVAEAHRDAERMAPRRRRGTGLTRLFH